jgi:putative heme iron utilization protein
LRKIEGVSQHAGPPRGPDEPAVPEPTFAERARTLTHQARTGTLATLSRRHPGHPFASIMPYALDPGGGPLWLISSMAMHTQNLGADPRASLLVTQPGAAGDPLASGRVTLMGRARRLAGDDVATARPAYLAAHPNAAYWVDFEDFSFWRLDVDDVYFVGGFAAMGWVEAAEYGAARPDPLAPAAEAIMEHMNADHADALRAYARHFAGEEADEARMVAVDRLGFKLHLTHGERRWSTRIAFPREVTTAAEGRTVLIEMARRARA